MKQEQTKTQKINPEHMRMLREIMRSPHEQSFNNLINYLRGHRKMGELYFQRLFSEITVEDADIQVLNYCMNLTEIGNRETSGLITEKELNDMQKYIRNYQGTFKEAILYRGTMVVKPVKIIVMGKVDRPCLGCPFEQSCVRSFDYPCDPHGKTIVKIDSDDWTFKRL